MYLSYYGLSHKPFEINTDPSFLWLGDDHHEALANLKYSLMSGTGLTVLTGEVGTGKTTLLRALLKRLDAKVNAVYMNCVGLDSFDFLSYIVQAFNPEVKVTHRPSGLISLTEILERALAEGKISLLMIDEAHQLSDDVLEEIRTLSDLEQNGKKLVQVVLAGQTLLKNRLLDGKHRALRQRISLFYHLRPLTFEDTNRYIEHRLQVAASSQAQQMFTPAATKSIYQYSRGYPRIINKLCDRALLTGFVQDRQNITKAIVRECAKEISAIDPLLFSSKILRLLVLFWAKLRTNTEWPIFSNSIKVNRTSNHLSENIDKGKSSYSSKVKQNNLIRNVIAVCLLLFIFWGVNTTRTTLQDEARADRKTSNQSLPDNAEAPVSVSPNTKDSPITSAISTNKHDIIPASTKEDTSAISKPPLAIDSEKHLSESENEAHVLSKISPELNPNIKLYHVSEYVQQVQDFVEKGDLQTAIEIIEANEDVLLSKTSPNMKKLYAQALVGRAFEIIDSTPELAVTYLKKAVEVDENNVDAYVQLGNFYTKKQDNEKALENYQKASDLKLLPDVLYNMGYVYASMGRYEEAEQMFSQVVTLQNDFEDKALFNLAVVQFKGNKLQESLTSLKAALSISPDNQQAQLLRNKLEDEIRDNP